jgi:hypothetical protein
MNIDSAVPLPDCIEGQEAFQRFDEGIRAILSIPHSTLVRRERAYRKKADANPRKRGPKRKVKPSASHGPVVS